MALKNEDEVKKALGLDSWRNLSKDKIVAFAAMMPDIASDVRLKLIEQFPKFKEFAVDLIKSLEQTQKDVLDSSDKSESNFHENQREILNILKNELDRDLTDSQREAAMDFLKDVSDKSFEKDSEGKRFRDGLFQKTAAVAGAAIVAAVIFVGAKVAIEKSE
mgnify:CR=1 FL=1